MIYKLKYKPFGNQAILIEWPSEINDSILKNIINFELKIKADKINLIEDIIIGYNSLTIKYSVAFESFQNKKEQLENSYYNSKTILKAKALTWHIPVCYHESFGLDLQSLSEEKNSTINNVIKLHIKATYKVYFIGFLPGFLYLGGLDAKLHINRKKSPRLNVTKGSVGIGGSQTGIYPSDSAGGWNIIGKTPISFFDVSQANPCFAKAGDTIKFVSISKPEFLKMEAKIAQGLYTLKPENNG